MLIPDDVVIINLLIHNSTPPGVDSSLTRLAMNTRYDMKLGATYINAYRASEIFPILYHALVNSSIYDGSHASIVELDFLLQIYGR